MPNLLIQPARVPSVSQAARNALAMRNQQMAGEAAQVQLQGAKTSNLLAEKQLGSYEKDREAAQTQARAASFFKGLDAISKVDDSSRGTVWNTITNLPVETMPKIKVEGEESTFEIPQEDGSLLKVSGPAAEIGPFVNYAKNNPDIVSPENWPKTQRMLEQGGVRFEVEAAGTEKTPTSAMAAFLQQNPKATAEEMAAFTKQLARAEAEGKAVGDTEKPLTKKEANKQIQKIEESIYKIESGQSVMDMVKDLPGFQSLLAEQEIDPNAPDAKQRIMDYYEDRLDELYTITGKKREKKKPQETQETVLDMTFENGKAVYRNQKGELVDRDTIQ